MIYGKIMSLAEAAEKAEQKRIDGISNIDIKILPSPINWETLR
jgi:hypothetical protein